MTALSDSTSLRSEIERIGNDQAKAEETFSAIGFEVASSLTNIWEPDEALAARVLEAIRRPAEYIGPAIVTFGADVGRSFRNAWIVGLSVLGATIAIVTLAETTQTDAAYGWLVVPMALAVVWLVFISQWSGRRTRETQHLVNRLIDVGFTSALQQVEERRLQARNHQPGDNYRDGRWGPPPRPQPYGVSHKGAEQLVAEWIRHLGEIDALVTQYVGDGGIDVESTHYIAQVKNYEGTVGVAEVRELGGVASVDGRKPLFFTSGTYAAGAIQFAARSGISLFVYDAMIGTLEGVNEAAKFAIDRGL